MDAIKININGWECEYCEVQLSNDDNQVWRGERGNEIIVGMFCPSCEGHQDIVLQFTDGGGDDWD